MCTECGNILHFEPEALIEAYQENLDKVSTLADTANSGSMNARDLEFATDLVRQFQERGSLSPKQMHWVGVLTERYVEIEPLYGDFKAIQVMFRLAADKIKQPKVRLQTEEGRYVQLNFNPKSKQIDVYVDGWAGHGYRKFAGWIKDAETLVPYMRDRMTDDVKNVIQELALDPEQVSKTMAARLGVCIYCAQRLTDERSKSAGYGPVCAKNYGLAWG